VHTDSLLLLNPGVISHISNTHPEHQSARMSKIQITNDGLTWSGTGCFTVVLIWQQCQNNIRWHM